MRPVGKENWHASKPSSNENRAGLCGAWPGGSPGKSWSNDSKSRKRYITARRGGDTDRAARLSRGRGDRSSPGCCSETGSATAALWRVWSLRLAFSKAFGVRARRPPYRRCEKLCQANGADLPGSLSGRAGLSQTGSWFPAFEKAVHFSRRLGEDDRKRQARYCPGLQRKTLAAATKEGWIRTYAENETSDCRRVYRIRSCRSTGEAARDTRDPERGCAGCDRSHEMGVAGI